MSANGPPVAGDHRPTAFPRANLPRPVHADDISQWPGWNAVALTNVQSPMDPASVPRSFAFSSATPDFLEVCTLAPRVSRGPPPPRNCGLRLLIRVSDPCERSCPAVQAVCDRARHSAGPPVGCGVVEREPGGRVGGADARVADATDARGDGEPGAGRHVPSSSTPRGAPPHR